MFSLKLDEVPGASSTTQKLNAEDQTVPDKDKQVMLIMLISICYIFWLNGKNIIWL